MPRRRCTGAFDVNVRARGSSKGISSGEFSAHGNAPVEPPHRISVIRSEPRDFKRGLGESSSAGPCSRNIIETSLLGPCLLEFQNKY